MLGCDIKTYTGNFSTEMVIDVCRDVRVNNTLLQLEKKKKKKNT